MTQSIVHSDFVTEDDIIAEYTTISCAHGDTVSYPVVAIAVTAGDRKEILHAAVSNKLPQAALIGWDAQPFLQHPLDSPQQHQTSKHRPPRVGVGTSLLHR